MKNEDAKGFYIAILLSILVIFITNQFFGKSKTVVENAPQIVAETMEKKEADLADKNIVLSLDEVLSQNPQVKIDTAVLSGSLRVAGGRIDNLLLKKYQQTMEPNSPDVELFAPAKTKNPYYAEFGWLAGNNNIKVPNANTIWNVKGSKLTADTPVVLEWNNGEGLKFITKISVDGDYIFSINQSVENNSNQEVTLYPYGMIARVNESSKMASVVHEGLIGVIDGSLKEVKYKDLADTKEEFETQNGWFGFSDRYWFSAIVLDAQQNSKVKFQRSGENLYQADYIGSVVKIASGSVGESQNLLYAGAKEIKVLDAYTKRFNIPKFDLAVDFGWYYFLTKPFFYVLDFLYHLIGNMGWAILLFAALLRLVMFPVANKSFTNMAKMKKMQPKLVELREKFADDKVKLQQETLSLYQKEKVNPAAGCLPMLIQIPVFFSLYKVLNIAIEIRHAPFVGWIKDLSAPDPLTLSAMTNLPIPSFVDIGVWPIVMGLTMYIQQKLNPAPTSKDQARMFAMLPLIFMFMMGHFASGLVIYWTLSNVLSIIQQKIIMRKNERN